MTQKSFQDLYPDVFAHCYGCGRLNEHGHQIKSYWDGDESVCHFLPKPYHIAIPGYVYGGLLASLIDCHGTGTAAGAVYRAAKEQGEDIEANPRFLTASLHVDYLKPTPLNQHLLELNWKYAAKSKNTKDARWSSKSGFSPTVSSLCTGKSSRCKCLSPW